jgi:GABA(A) receptor-associated protein
MYKQNKTFEQRKQECDSILEKYPSRIPVIVEIDLKSNIPKLDKFKFLVPNNYTMSQCSFLIRKRISLTQEQTLFFNVKNVFPSSNDLMAIIYKEYKDEDGFLYMTIYEENVFG